MPTQSPWNHSSHLSQQIMNLGGRGEGEGRGGKARGGGGEGEGRGGERRGGEGRGRREKQ